MMSMRTLLMSLLAVLMVGCANKTTLVNQENDTRGPNAALDYRDFSAGASQMVESLIMSGSLNHSEPGQRVIVVMEPIINDTHQDFSTTQLTKKIRSDLLRSGKVIFTNAYGETKSQTIRDIRNEARGDAEVKQDTIAGKHTIIVPDYSISGVIRDRYITTDNGDTQIEYYFMLSLNNLENGLAYWEDEVSIVKQTDQDSVVW